MKTPWSQVDIPVEKLHFSDANHTARHSGASIASGGAELVASLAKIISISMNHHSPANDAVCSRQSNQTISEVNRSLSIISCGQVAKITDVTFLVRGTSMSLAQRIEVRPSTDATYTINEKVKCLIIGSKFRKIPLVLSPNSCTWNP
jgi:hypothetical protein